MYTENNVKTPSKIAFLLDGLFKNISQNIYSHLAAAIVPSVLVFLGTFFMATRAIGSVPGELNAQQMINEQQNLILEQMKIYVQTQDLINKQIGETLNNIQNQMNTLISKI